MVQFLEELQGVATPSLSAEELVELEMLRVKHEKLKTMKNKVGGGAQAAVQENLAAANKKKKQAASSSSSDSEVSREETCIFQNQSDSFD